MSASFHTLPVWKKDSTPAEWLSEISGLAMERPERFGRIVIVFEKTNEKGHAIETRWHQYGIETNTDIVGTLEVAKQEVIDFMKGRRD